ncbi:MAG: DUF2135 domain-containing protein [Polyangiaceae bacterium]|nr:DUF2135 domain-containing protein [Polyangiaceae bacterium]
MGDREELPLRSSQVTVRVDGFRARVTLDFFYENDRDRAYEGTFQLRLPDEASPDFFAFGEVAARAPSGPVEPAKAPAERAWLTGPVEVMRAREGEWSGPREARIVPREKAAFAYGQTVRARVDPALMEWAGAGVFEARVFPLAAKKTHRIVVAYDVPLVAAGDDFVLDLDLPPPGPKLEVDVAVSKPAGLSLHVTPAAPGAAEGARTLYHYENPSERTLSLRVKGAKGTALTGEGPGGAFFAYPFRADLPAEKPGAPGADAAVFALDTSLSSNPDKFNVWLKLLRAVLDQNRAQLKRFNVLFFSVDTGWFKPGFVENTPEHVAELMAEADRRALEGATDLGAALSEAAHPHWAGAPPAAPYDIFLLSDGASTWGEADTHSIARAMQGGRAGALFAYRTGMAGSDGAALDLLARERGGAVFSVVGEAEVASAAVAHRSRPWQIESVALEGAGDLLLAGRPRAVFAGQRLTLVGRGAPRPGAEVVLALRRGDARVALRSKLARALASPLAARAYGQVAVAQLEEFDEPSTASATRAYATQFRVTGKTCSLLMLESEADYARFGIKPGDDEAIVKGTPASAAVTRAGDLAEGALGDPKRGFLRFLEALEAAPGVRYKTPAALRETLEAMPTASFAFTAPPLAVRRTTREGIAPSLLEDLSRHELSYDAVAAEAERRRRELGPADALKALSSLVEERPGDGVLARDVGYSALEWGLSGQAYRLFERVARTRPYEPQSYRAMAQALAREGRADLALALYEVLLAAEWNPRFGEFKKIVGFEYVRLLRDAAAGRAKVSVPAFATNRLAELKGRFGPDRADLVVMITWNTDNTDVDLHVTEPSGEECFYSHRETRSGGNLTQDVTRGYGPEMYLLPRAKSGKYKVRAHYYASDRNRASAATKVYATLVEHWGEPNEKVTERVVTLAAGKQMHEVAELIIGP